MVNLHIYFLKPFVLLFEFHPETWTQSMHSSPDVLHLKVQKLLWFKSHDFEDFLV